MASKTNHDGAPKPVKLPKPRQKVLNKKDRELLLALANRLAASARKSNCCSTPRTWFRCCAIWA